MQSVLPTKPSLKHTPETSGDWISEDSAQQHCSNSSRMLVPSALSHQWSADIPVMKQEGKQPQPDSVQTFVNINRFILLCIYMYIISICININVFVNTNTAWFRIQFCCSKFQITFALLLEGSGWVKEKALCSGFTNVWTHKTAECSSASIVHMN